MTKFTDMVFESIKQEPKNHAVLDELIYKPKVIRTYQENGHTITVYEAAHAEGCGCDQWVKPNRGGRTYEISI